MKRLVSERSVMLIKVLLTDPHIAEKVMENTTDKEKYKICTVREDGTIILGKTSIRWWNQLLSCQDKIPFESFALRVWDALVDLSSGLNNKAIMEGLSREIVMQSVRKLDYDYIVDRLFDVARHVCQNGTLAVTASSADGRGKSGLSETVTVQKPNVEGIVIKIDGVQERVIPFKDSIGDPFIDVVLTPKAIVRR